LRDAPRTLACNAAALIRKIGGGNKDDEQLEAGAGAECPLARRQWASSRKYEKDEARLPAQRRRRRQLLLHLCRSQRHLSLYCALYIVRGHDLGGDMEAFIPDGSLYWQAYFEPLPSYAMGYASQNQTHFSKKFPDAFI
jgi:hypothetical protein